MASDPAAISNAVTPRHGTIMQLELPEKMLEKLAMSDRITIVIERPAGRQNARHISLLGWREGADARSVTRGAACDRRWAGCVLSSRCDWDPHAGTSSTTALDGTRRNDGNAVTPGDGTIMRVQDLPKVLEKLANVRSHHDRDERQPEGKMRLTSLRGRSFGQVRRGYVLGSLHNGPPTADIVPLQLRMSSSALTMTAAAPVSIGEGAKSRAPHRIGPLMSALGQKQT